ncbi:putative Endoribonuclease [Martensiomyces pterosporus]|nr:putative Endoribonuclease [Martensiomyces pterosporus]
MDLTQRTKVASGGPYEDLVGYSRVLATGPFVYVAGTTAGSDGSPIPASCKDQTRQTVEIMRKKLEQVSCTLDEVVRVRMFVVDIKRDWQEVSEVMNSYFQQTKPVMTMVQIAKLIDDDMLIEIEMDAVRKTAA